MTFRAEPLQKQRADRHCKKRVDGCYGEVQSGMGLGQVAGVISQEPFVFGGVRKGKELLEVLQWQA